MKQLSLLLTMLFLFSFLQLHTQEWAPVGAEWRYAYNATGFSQDQYTMIRIDKDTIVAGQECRKYTVYDQPAGANTNVFNHVGYTFERNDSIFHWHQDSFLLQYDFSANVGDTITIPTPGFSSEPEDADYFRVMLDSISIVPFGISNFLVEKHHTSFIDGPYDYFGNGFYKIIGSSTSWGGLYYRGVLPTVGIPYAKLSCYQDANHEIFHIDANFSCGFPSATLDLIDKNQLKLYPNPVKNKLRIQYDASLKGAEFRLLNQLGEVLMDGYLPKTATAYELSIQQLPKGFLYLEVQNDNHVGVWKLVKM